MQTLVKILSSRQKREGIVRYLTNLDSTDASSSAFAFIASAKLTGPVQTIFSSNKEFKMLSRLGRRALVQVSEKHFLEALSASRGQMAQCLGRESATLSILERESAVVDAAVSSGAAPVSP